MQVENPTKLIGCQLNYEIAKIVCANRLSIYIRLHNSTHIVTDAESNHIEKFHQSLRN